LRLQYVRTILIYDPTTIPALCDPLPPVGMTAVALRHCSASRGSAPLQLHTNKTGNDCVSHRARICICMYVSIYLYICKCIYLGISTHLSICASIYLSIYLSIYIYISLSLSLSLYIYIYIYICATAPLRQSGLCSSTPEHENQRVRVRVQVKGALCA